MKTVSPFKILKNDKGVLTLDFIFAITVTACFAAIFMAISFTLSMLEVSQYVTFATSRAYMAAHNTPSDQIRLGTEKFSELVNTPGVLKNLLTSGWIVLTAPGPSSFGDHSDLYPTSGDPGDAESRRFAYTGVQIKFFAKVLHLQMPILGDATTQSGTGSATLNSYLSREVTTQECQQNFVQQRYSKLIEVSGAAGTPASSTPAQIISDNGC